MKREMKNIFKLILAITGLLLYTGCSTNEQQPVEDEKTEVTFQFDAKALIDAKGSSITDGYQKCLDQIDVNSLKVNITITGPENKTLTNVPVKLYGSDFMTAPIELKPGTYTVTNVVVYSGITPVYAGVVDDQNPNTPLPLFASFIPSDELMGNKKFTLLNYTKPTVTLYVLCAKYDPASSFGMPKFQLSFVEVTCFDIFVNVCDKNGVHVVGEGTVYLIPHGTPMNGSQPDYTKAIYKDNFSGGAIENGRPVSAGDLATVCFPNNLDKADNLEIYDLVLVVNNAISQQIFTYVVTVEDLLRYKESDLWDSQLNVIHIQYCDGIPFCILPNRDCGGGNSQCGPFMPGKNGLEDFNSYNTKVALQAAWPWTIKNTDKISVIGLQATAATDADDYIYVKGNQQGEVTWTSSVFNFRNGDIIEFDAAIRKLNSLDQPGEPGGNSFDAWLKVNLVDAQGRKLGTEWKTKMQSDAAFNFVNYHAVNRRLGTGCYRLEITLDMQSGSQERFEFKMDNVKVTSPSQPD